MPHQFDLLPIELQASMVELRAAGVSEDTIDALIARTLGALGVKSNKVQVEVWQMEERLGMQLTQIGDKLQGDLQTQHGATNQMLADLNTAWANARPAIEEAGRGIAELKKQWSELGDWRSRVEAALVGLTESRDQSVEARKQSKQERAEIRDEIAKMNRRHERQLAEQDKRHNKEIAAFTQRMEEMERHLGIADHHEAGS